MIRIKLLTDMRLGGNSFEKGKELDLDELTATVLIEKKQAVKVERKAKPKSSVSKSSAKQDNKKKSSKKNSKGVIGILRRKRR